MREKRAYVSILSSNDFLYGILVLNFSLKKVNSKEQLLVLITPNISDDIFLLLKRLDINVKKVEHIKNPNDKLISERFLYNYSKLHIFNLVEYDKIVYLDADMLVCNNIDILFSKKNFSAVNAGGDIPELSDWVDLNAGLLVVEPDNEVFADMMRKKEVLPSASGGDQGFLHSYFPQWPNRKDLHLFHGYNMYVGHISKYIELFDFQLSPGRPRDKDISILHFWGNEKPWNETVLENRDPMYNKAFQLWRLYLKELRDITPEDI